MPYEAAITELSKHYPGWAAILITLILSVIFCWKTFKEYRDLNCKLHVSYDANSVALNDLSETVQKTKDSINNSINIINTIKRDFLEQIKENNRVLIECHNSKAIYDYLSKK
jgi:hypothetical protein